MESRTVSIRTESGVLDDIDKAAKAEDRSRNWWINQAIKTALADEEAWLEKINTGLKAADENQFATEAEVEETFARFDPSR